MIRRQALLGLAGLAVVGAIATGSAIVGGSDAEGVVEILHKRLSYLKLDIRGVRQFAREPFPAGQMADPRWTVANRLADVVAWEDQREGRAPKSLERLGREGHRGITAAGGV